jgi:hypothetical protein
MPEADGMILAKEEENDAEVRREDQDKINEFGQLNARLYEVRSEIARLKVRGERFLALLFGVVLMVVVYALFWWWLCCQFDYSTLNVSFPFATHHFNSITPKTQHSTLLLLLNNPETSRKD